jgi:hypothetical protein
LVAAATNNALTVDTAPPAIAAAAVSALPIKESRNCCPLRSADTERSEHGQRLRLQPLPLIDVIGKVPHQLRDLGDRGVADHPQRGGDDEEADQVGDRVRPREGRNLTRQAATTSGVIA